MAVKYECPECGRRFLEWGAEKFGFKCPVDENCPEGHPDGIELTPIVFEQDQPIRRKPTLKRGAAAAKRKRAAAKIETEESLLQESSDDTEPEISVGAKGVPAATNGKDEAVSSDAGSDAIFEDDDSESSDSDSSEDDGDWS